MAGESKLQRECKQYAEERLILFRKLKAEGQDGWPDVLLLRDGVFILCEMKNPNGKGRLQASQPRECKRIRGRGGVVYQVSNFEQFKQIVKRHYHHEKMQSNTERAEHPFNDIGC